MSTSSAWMIKGIAWLVLSPFAALMALLSSVQSPAVYYTQLSAFGLWSFLGILSGLGLLLRKRSAPPIQKGLLFVVGAYFAFAALGMVGFLASAVLNGGVADPVQGWGLTALLLVLVLMAWAFVRRRQSPVSHGDD